MMMLWLCYSVVVGALIMSAARFAERLALVFGRATRFVWIGAMLLTVVASIGGLVIRTAAQRRADPLVETPRAGVTPTPTSEAWWQSLMPVDVAASRAGIMEGLRRRMDTLTERLSPFDRVVLFGWALMSTFFGAVVLYAALESRRLLSACEARQVKGTRVLLTDAMGPAAVGLGASAVLLPRWTLDLEDQLLDLVLRHEREHLMAGDPPLLLGGLFFVVLLPWQLPMWWAWQRLRLAVEIDCDRRLLRSGRDTKRYAQLLLLMGQRIAHRSTVLHPLITVTAPLQPELSHLATRIQIMTQLSAPRAARSIIVLAAGMVATASIALAVPMPRSVATPSPQQPVVQGNGRTMVRITSVGLEGVEWAANGSLKGEVLIHTTGGAKVGIGTGELKPIRDTLHLKSLPAFTADVTDGEVHIWLAAPAKGTIELKATVTGGVAKSFTGKDSYLVLMKGGAGVKRMFATNPMFIVDGVKTMPDVAMRISRDSITSVEVFKEEAALAKYGKDGTYGVIVITTKRAGAPPTAKTANPTDTATRFFEFQVDEPVQYAAGSGHPMYPAAEKAAGTEATVLAQFVVGSDGLVEPGTFRVLSGTMMNAEGKKLSITKPEHDYGPFELAVRDCLPSLRFTPAKRSGVTVRQIVQQPFVFAIAK